MFRRYASLVCFVLAITSAAVLGQGALTQVGLDEGAAQDLVLKNLGNPSSQRDNMHLTTAYKKVPASARGPLATQLYAWTKAYVNSPAFKKAYAAWREENKPIEKHEGTVDREVKARLAKMKAEVEASYKELVAAGRKAQAEQMKKMFDTTMAQMEPAVRMEIEEANTADVDFAAKQVQRRNGIGELEWVFVNEPYNKKPWQWKKSYEFGAEGSAAARAAAAAWLKEIGPR